MFTIGDVMGEWIRLVQIETPWCDMQLDDLTGGWRRVLAALLSDAEDASVDRRVGLRRVARTHGEFRRRQRCTPQALSDEVTLMQAAIAELLLRHGASVRVAEQALELLASDLHTIGRAAYAGYVDGPSSRRFGA